MVALPLASAAAEAGEDGVAWPQRRFIKEGTTEA
jgi:hypothetical protein